MLSNTLSRTAVLVAVVLSFASIAAAQNSSLFGNRNRVAVKNQPGTTLENGSWYYRSLPPPKPLQVHDLVTIRVSEKSLAASEGELERRKSASYDAVLSDWIYLDGIKAIRPTPNSDGDPRANGSLDRTYRSEADMETAEEMAFIITASIADIRPNGNLVLEAHKTIRNNDEVWEYSLTGVCRSNDIDPNNIILSEDIADLRLEKRERGAVRDGYRRGWFTRWFDVFHPF